MKRYAIIFIALFTLISCGVVESDSSSKTSGSLSIVNKTRDEVVDFVLKSINEADALNMTYKVRNHVDNDIIEITFLYVCNNSDNTKDFEMSMMTFMKVNDNNEINIVKSYYHDREFYLSLFNVSDGEFDLYKVNIDEDLNMDELTDLTGISLFYSSPNDELFKRITRDVLLLAEYKSFVEYQFNFNNDNTTYLKKISVDKSLTTIKIETDEFDDNSNRIEQIVNLIPKFGSKYKIEFTDKKDNYTSITLEELGKIMTN